MVRFGVHWIVVAAAVALGEAALPGVWVANRTEQWVGAGFVGLLNAGIRPAIHVAGWPLTLFTFAAVVVTLNGIVFSLAGPISGSWSITSYWQGLAEIIGVSVVSWAVGVWGESPYRASI